MFARMLAPATLLLIACGSTPTPLLDGGAGDAQEGDSAPERDGGDVGTLREVLVTVENGWGTGRYPIGAEIHVFADAPPEIRTCNGWTGEGRALLLEPDEWHTTMVVPDHDVTVTATFLDTVIAPTRRTHRGVTSELKEAFLFRPLGTVRGLLLMLHGTGGNAGFALRGESLAVVQRALADGWAVLSPEAEESVAGDLNGDGKLRWDVGIAADNADFGNLAALVTEVRSELGLDASHPNAAIGMSNGGSMALALGAASALDGGAFPALRFDAVVVHCASGASGYAMFTTTPSAFLGCAADDNPQVDLAQIESNHGLLVSRGIRTLFRLHPPSPLYGERFTRVPGIDASTSMAIAVELSPWLDGDRYFTTTSDVIVTEVMSRPASYPAVARLAPAAQGGVVDQIRATMAAHQMYADWAATALAFLEVP